MDNKKLLELAAEAVQNGAQWDCPERGMMVLTEDGVDTCTWNPLDDDGDALRLAVKLELAIVLDTYCVQVGRHDFEQDIREETTMGYGLEAATRRAIVRAAAEIGSTP